jgi:hypothetical protein
VRCASSWNVAPYLGGVQQFGRDKSPEARDCSELTSSLAVRLWPAVID